MIQLLQNSILFHQFDSLTADFQRIRSIVILRIPDFLEIYRFLRIKGQLVAADLEQCCRKFVRLALLAVIQNLHPIDQTARNGRLAYYSEGAHMTSYNIGSAL